ncbi:MAG: twin-arginine translocase subunit TatC [Candidatus Omnitrophota bacterium]
MDRDLTLIEHLGELRKRLIISLVAFGIGTVMSLPLASHVLRVLKEPAGGLIDKLAYFSPQEAFLIYMRLAFLCGLFVSMPVILHQVWVFIAPALEEKARKFGMTFILFCSAAFFSGSLFAYFFLIPPAIKFLLSFAQDELVAVISASKYISFVMTIILGCGFVFQMPILSFILTKLGIINPRFLRKKYKYALVIILIVAAAITPTPDAFNMLMLALPMLLLYETSIWVSFFARRKIPIK